MANKIYFKTKGYSNAIFSNDIFKEPGGKVSLVDSLKVFNDLNNETGIRNYTNLKQIIEDDVRFTLLTENSFTQSELLIIRDALHAYATLDTTGKSIPITEKIDTMIFSGNYLPDDKSEIINK